MILPNTFLLVECKQRKKKKEEEEAANKELKVLLLF